MYVKYSIERLCGQSTRESRLYLESVDGIKRFPNVSKKLDKTFYVRLDEKMWKTLRDARYTVLHRPIFAMMGSTRLIVELNPYSKSGVDATKEGADSISWEEFFTLCEDNEIDWNNKPKGVYYEKYWLRGIIGKDTNI